MTDFTASAYFLENIVFNPDPVALMKRLHIKEASASSSEFRRMLENASALARPTALYLQAYITERGEDWVELDGVRFSSRVLQVNLSRAYRVFPYLATCGKELQEWAQQYDDMLLRFWAEAIKEEALQAALLALGDALQTRYLLGHTASMNPGSLEDWPIQQQTVLFGLFGELADQVGVQLTESLLMVPTKSVSGIFFPTEAAFESCELCPRQGCPGRRAPYEPHLYDDHYAQQNKLVG